MQVEKYRLQLELLREGRLVDAMAVRTGGNKSTERAVKAMEDGAGDYLPRFTSVVPPVACPCILDRTFSVALLTSPRMTFCEGCRT